MGKEYKAKGIDVALAPVIGPLGRVVTGGRVWVGDTPSRKQSKVLTCFVSQEGFSTDPYLAGSLVHPTIKGLQESVVACAKHFVANEQVHTWHWSGMAWAHT
jgi:beta-glucosidase